MVTVETKAFVGVNGCNVSSGMGGQSGSEAENRGGGADSRYAEIITGSSKQRGSQSHVFEPAESALRSLEGVDKGHRQRHSR